MRDIDRSDSKIKVVVSVLMLREGWDVRNVTVVLGLRPFKASAKILPEQAVGRGLRLMGGDISPDRTQTLEVLGTHEFEKFVRGLEMEGVGIRTVTTPPSLPVKVEPVWDKMEFDISIPSTETVYKRSYQNLSNLDPLALTPLYEWEMIGKRSRVKLRMEFATTETDVHETDIELDSSPPAHELISSITGRVETAARLRSGWFARLYPIVRNYTAKRCFGGEVDLDDEGVRSHLRSPRIQEQIAGYLAGEIGQATVETKPLQFESGQLKLSKTKEFTWRRNLPLVDCHKTIFNLVATYNDYEKKFAQFLDGCPDVARFAALGTTEQESGASFRVNYLKPSGAIGFYYPDFVVVQQIGGTEVNWIVETKGRVWEDTEAKDRAIRHWCEGVSTATGVPWSYVRVNQSMFDSLHPSEFGELTEDSGDESLLPDELHDGLVEESPPAPQEESQGTTPHPPELQQQIDDPTSSELLKVLHDCVPDGAHIEHKTLLRAVSGRLGYPEMPGRIRRLLNKAIDSEQRAGRLRTDWEQVWRPRKAKKKR